ncbi:MAG TPA: MBL fold metallo-hydrolase [Nocardioides sp.]|uniref:MBL fold metallo-hydrolase n=1 Tax=Nocardioides sp. TaxID=35761 RepID=UPI002F3F7843
MPGGPYVTSLGHAGLRIENDHVRVLADPWFAERGAFLASWFPFPDNSHVRTPSLQDVDVVSISHEHLDHLDLDLVAALPEHVPVVVPRYPSTILERRLRGTGHERVVVLDAWERYPLSDHEDWMTVIPEVCPMTHDAAVLFHVGGRVVLHCNDARISLAQVRRAMVETGRGVDFMAVQMSGASWHPVVYEYEGGDRARIEEVKRVGKFKAVTRLVRSVAPGMVVPYAGPPCFLDDDLFEHNPRLHTPGDGTGPDGGGEGIFPGQDQAVAWLRDRLPDQPSTYLLPGDVYDAATGQVSRDPQWTGFRLDAPPTERRAYLEAYAARRRGAIQEVWRNHPVPADDDTLAQDFRRHFEHLGRLSSYFLARAGLTVRFEVLGPGGGTWDAHIGPDRMEVDLDGTAQTVDYRIRVEGRWLAGVVAGRIRWEELLLSLRFSARREPDLYNDYLVGLLKHADLEALRAIEAYELRRSHGDLITVRDGDRAVRIGRYCPHGTEDLSETGVVRDGVLRCLGHNFEFDLTTGECLNARCDPLEIERATVPV